MKTPCLYLETSVWNFLFADDAPDKKAATEKLFAEIEHGKFRIFVSDIVLREINNAPADIRSALIGKIEKYRPTILTEDEEVIELVRFYLENNLLSENQLADLGHVAAASANEIDILISWNMRHIVKRSTKIVVNALNQIKGFRPIDIYTPEEVIDNDED